MPTSLQQNGGHCLRAIERGVIVDLPTVHGDSQERRVEQHRKLHGSWHIEVERALQNRPVESAALTRFLQFKETRVGKSGRHLAVELVCLSLYARHRSGDDRRERSIVFLLGWEVGLSQQEDGDQPPYETGGTIPLAIDPEKLRKQHRAKHRGERQKPIAELRNQKWRRQQRPEVHRRPGADKRAGEHGHADPDAA